MLERAETHDHDKVEIEVREPGDDLEEYITTEGFERESGGCGRRAWPGCDRADCWLRRMHGICMILIFGSINANAKMIKYCAHSVI